MFPATIANLLSPSANATAASPSQLLPRIALRLGEPHPHGCIRAGRSEGTLHANATPGHRQTRGEREGGCAVLVSQWDDGMGSEQWEGCGDQKEMETEMEARRG